MWCERALRSRLQCSWLRRQASLGYKSPLFTTCLDTIKGRPYLSWPFRSIEVPPVEVYFLFHLLLDNCSRTVQTVPQAWGHWEKMLQVGVLLPLNQKACSGLFKLLSQTNKFNWNLHTPALSLPLPGGLKLLHIVVFSSISAILSGVIGVHYGHVLIHFKVLPYYFWHINLCLSGFYRFE